MVGRFAAVPLLLLTTWSLVGCYAYVPVVTPPQRELSGEVRVVLTPAGSVALRQMLGANVREVEGTVARNSADTVVLAVHRTLTTTKEAFASKGDTVAVQRQYVESMAVQQHSRKRSIGLAVVIASLVIIGLTGIVAGSSGTSGEGLPVVPPP